VEGIFVKEKSGVIDEVLLLYRSEKNKVAEKRNNHVLYDVGGICK